MEEEAKKSETALAETVTKLAVTSKEADNVLKSVKVSIIFYLFNTSQAKVFMGWREWGLKGCITPPKQLGRWVALKMLGKNVS